MNSLSGIFGRDDRMIDHSSNKENIWKQNFEHNLKSYFDKIPQLSAIAFRR
ncbi:hypothetical protein PN471_09415 [Aphanizomenon sp. CS-733/32]|uniref:hypothetical protein n=1 Tax=Aphanizomenon sp. CS-733/32 TaxID=3021715 RepID=UPI0023302F93|nr:hypothetical protein [Aphanizomenon sp. CS-733/32]MDB9308851.1 hypothetical protein [Aphanizomenon sp. CS-733/32]